MFEQHQISHEEAAALIGTTVVGLRRAIAGGNRFTTEQAERVAAAIRIPPSVIWPDWNEELGIRIWEPMPWAEHGACLGESHLFFPAPGERPEQAAAREHFAITDYCARCPVLVECRDYARRNREYGVWGGETEEDRAVLGYGVAMPVGTMARLISAYGRNPRFTKTGRAT